MYLCPASATSTHLLSSGYQSVQGSLVSVYMMMKSLIGLQGNTYVDGVPTDDLTQELDHCAKMVYAEHIEEQNWEEVARYADSGLESD